MKNVFDFKNWNSLNESENGKIPDSELVPIPVLKGKNYGHKLNPEAAKDYSDMVDAAKRDGVVWGITDSYRSYKVQSLKLIEFDKMTDCYHFDTEIIIEFLKKKLTILEIYIPTFYGDEVSHLKSIPYGLKVLLSTLKSKFIK